jgi:5-methylcytosine-specific restriction endonuclease McrA
MMTLEEDRKVLILNKNWHPINVIPSLKAAKDLYSGRLDVVTSTYQIYDFFDWVENWSDFKEIENFNGRMIRTPSFTFPLPEIAKVRNYKGCYYGPANFNRENIFIRDNFTCQYCGKKKAGNELNMDHILPRSRGGKSNWMNIVLSCIPCNTKKADRTPEEAGMPLLRQPFTPTWSQLRTKIPNKPPKSWEELIGNLYWKTELK